MESPSIERKLTTILHADVAGYSRLMGADEVDTLHTLTAYRHITDPLIQQHRGRVVGSAGDSILAEFASVVEAVQCAVEIQHSLQEKNTELPPDQRMEFRIGINLGDVMVEGEQIYGDGVNVAARLQALADPGGIFISGTVYDQVKTKLTLPYEDLGEQHVKNIAEAERAIALDPNNADSYMALAEILTYPGRSAEAIGWMEKAMRLNPRYPALYLRILGTAYYWTGRTEEAIAAFESALARNPNWLAAHLFLAFVYSEVGREAEARAEAAEVLRLSPNFSLEGVRQRVPLKDPAALERMIAALRKAGLK